LQINILTGSKANRINHVVNVLQLRWRFRCHRQHRYLRQKFTPEGGRQPSQGGDGR